MDRSIMVMPPNNPKAVMPPNKPPSVPNKKPNKKKPNGGCLSIGLSIIKIIIYLGIIFIAWRVLSPIFFIAYMNTRQSCKEQFGKSFKKFQGDPSICYEENSRDAKVLDPYYVPD